MEDEEDDDEEEEQELDLEERRFYGATSEQTSRPTALLVDAASAAAKEDRGSGPLSTPSHGTGDDGSRAAFLGVGDERLEAAVAPAPIRGTDALADEKDAQIEELRARVERLEWLAQAALAR